MTLSVVDLRTGYREYRGGERRVVHYAVVMRYGVGSVGWATASSSCQEWTLSEKNCSFSVRVRECR